MPLAPLAALPVEAASLLVPAAVSALVPAGLPAAGLGERVAEPEWAEVLADTLEAGTAEAPRLDSARCR